MSPFVEKPQMKKLPASNQKSRLCRATSNPDGAHEHRQARPGADADQPRRWRGR
jgi:hypothetical protein